MKDDERRDIDIGIEAARAAGLYFMPLTLRRRRYHFCEARLDENGDGGRRYYGFFDDFRVPMAIFTPFSLSDTFIIAMSSSSRFARCFQALIFFMGANYRVKIFSSAEIFSDTGVRTIRLPDSLRAWRRRRIDGCFLSLLSRSAMMARQAFHR